MDRESSPEEGEILEEGELEPEPQLIEVSSVQVRWYTAHLCCRHSLNLNRSRLDICEASGARRLSLKRLDAFNVATFLRGSLLQLSSTLGISIALHP